MTENLPRCGETTGPRGRGRCESSARYQASNGRERKTVCGTHANYYRRWGYDVSLITEAEVGGV